MANKTIVDRISEAKGTGKEVKFRKNDGLEGKEYSFTPDGLVEYLKDLGFVQNDTAVPTKTKKKV